MKIPKKEGVEYYTLHFSYKGEAQYMEYEIQQKFGEVNYIFYSKTRPTFYLFRKQDGEQFQLVYGKLPDDLVKVLIEACEEAIINS